MSFTYNPPHTVSAVGAGSLPGFNKAKLPQLGGLAISPEQDRSRRSAGRPHLILAMMILGFFAASCLFIAALAMIVLA